VGAEGTTSKKKYTITKNRTRHHIGGVQEAGQKRTLEKTKKGKGQSQVKVAGVARREATTGAKRNNQRRGKKKLDQNYGITHGKRLSLGIRLRKNPLFRETGGTAIGFLMRLSGGEGKGAGERKRAADRQNKESLMQKANHGRKKVHVSR